MISLSVRSDAQLARPLPIFSDIVDCSRCYFETDIHAAAPDP
jgi:hypothetical protein